MTDLGHDCVEATGQTSGVFLISDTRDRYFILFCFFYMTKSKFYIAVNTQNVQGTDMSMLFSRVTKGGKMEVVALRLFIP